MKTLLAQDETGRDSVWNLFELTGSIDAYMLYKDLNGGEMTRKNWRADPDADQDRRDYDP